MIILAKFGMSNLISREEKLELKLEIWYGDYNQYSYLWSAKHTGMIHVANKAVSFEIIGLCTSQL